MDASRTRGYYDERYRAEGTGSFPADPSRYRAWFGPFLGARTSAGTLLDYGCGVGYVCSLFADQGWEVTGVDIAPAALDLAREREPRARFLEASEDGSLPSPDAHFDLIACLGTLEHIPDPAPVVTELRRVVRDDGAAIWVVPNARSPFFWFGRGTDQIEEHPRSLDGWRELLAARGWAVESVRRDPGPIDRRIAFWKRIAQAALNRLPLELTYQFIIETRPV